MKLKIRDLFDEPIVGYIDQGYVFCGAKSELYPSKKVLGIVITPRCDIAQNKVGEFHYLPIVSLCDWKAIEFPLLFCDKLLKETVASIKEKLIKNSISPTIIDTFSYHDVVGMLQDKLSGKDFDYMHERIKILEDIDQFHRTGDMDIMNKLLSICPGPRKTILKELLSNKLPNYYVLETNEEHFIIRLRELKKLDSLMFYNIGKGVTFDDLSDDDFLRNDIAIINPDVDMIYPIMALKSPYIEHLMQSFLLWFSRIGVDDIDSNTHEYMIKTW